MCSMFSDAKQFNQPLDKWTISKVENMNDMFHGASVFNQPCIENWNVSKVKYMNCMFHKTPQFAYKRELKKK